MAKRVVINDYEIIELTRREVIASEMFFSEDGSLCGNCHLCGHEPLLDEIVYYIPVLDVIYCKNCCDLFANSSFREKRDEKMAKKRFKMLKDVMVEFECWEEE